MKLPGVHNGNYCIVPGVPLRRHSTNECPGLIVSQDKIRRIRLYGTRTPRAILFKNMPHTSKQINIYHPTHRASVMRTVGGHVRFHSILFSLTHFTSVKFRVVQEHSLEFPTVHSEAIILSIPCLSREWDIP